MKSLNKIKVLVASATTSLFCAGALAAYAPVERASSLSFAGSESVVASGSIGSGAKANGSIGSGAKANGSIGSGAKANGSIGSGAKANGSIGSGAKIS